MHRHVVGVLYTPTVCTHVRQCTSLSTTCALRSAHSLVLNTKKLKINDFWGK